MLVWVLLAGLLQACSAVKVFYNQSPDFAFWYLDGHFDFNGTQSLQVKDELARLQTWHRQTQLQAYADTLKKLQQQLPADIDAVAACMVFADVRQKLLTVSSRVEPAVTAVAQTLNARQLVQLEKRFGKSNASYREDFLEGSLAARREKRIKEGIRRAEMLYGTLEHRQRGVIRQRVLESRFDANLSYAEKLRRQRDAVQTLQTLVDGRATAGAAHLAIHGLFERTVNSPNPVYRDYLEALTQDGCQTAAALHNSTTTAQRQKAVDTLKAYELDFRTLAAQQP
ncbi:MAG: DUF6279 family lipoprotein [Polaromonas sp.]